jgi:beta-lactamase class A
MSIKLKSFGGRAGLSGLFAATLAAASLPGQPAAAGVLDAPALKARLGALTESFNGKAGFCARSGDEQVCVKGDRAFPMHSVMKLLIAVTVMDQVDQRRLKLDDPVVVRRADASGGVEPIIDKIPASGSYQTTIDAVLTSMVVDSDSAACDLLLARLGGPATVREALARKGLSGMRLDRDERHQGAAMDGLVWRPTMADPAAMKKALAAVPAARRLAAFEAYLKDPRDKASPAAMALLLQRLSDGRLLSPASTDHLLGVMAQTRTGQDRLKAGLKAGWSLAHKTGTGGVRQGLSAGANDVGVLTAPDGGKVVVAAFVTNTRAPMAEQERLIAAMAHAVVDSYIPGPIRR